MKAFVQLCTLGMIACAFQAQAQWQWVDESGRKVFSDRPPPQHIASDKVLQKPRSLGANRTELSPSTAPFAAAPRAAPAEAAAPAGTPPLAPKEGAQASPSPAAEQTAAATRQADCQRAQRSKATLESGRAVSFINAKGERELMSEQARQEELTYINEVIAANCQ